MTVLSRPRRQSAPAAFEAGQLAALPPGQQTLGRALLEEPEVFAYGSIQQVGHRCGVDSVAVLRFAQRLGYSGHRALQAAVRAAIAPRAEHATTPPGPTAATVRRLEALWAHHQTNLEQAHRRITAVDLDRAASLLVGARRALVTGAGAAAGVARLLSSLLCDVGIEAVEVSAAGASALTRPSPGDVVVGIDLDALCDTRRTLDAARIHGADTIEITAACAESHPREGLTLFADAHGPGLAVSAVAALAVAEMIAAEVAGRLERGS